MKKTYLFFSVMFGVLLAGTMVLANQIVDVNGEEVVNFSLDDIDFGSAPPGTLVDRMSTITLDVSNNVDFTVDIELEIGSNSVFNEILFDLSSYGGAIDERLGDGPLQADIDDADDTDTSTEQVKDIPVSLTLPVGSLPGPRTGTIVYTIAGTTP